MWLVTKTVRKGGKFVAVFEERTQAETAIKMDASQVLAVYEHEYVLKLRVRFQYRRDEFERWSVHSAYEDIHDPDFDAGAIGCEWSLQSFVQGAWVNI